MHKTQSPHQVGSTAWYKSMANKLVDVAFDSMALRLEVTRKGMFSGRHARMIADQAKKLWWIARKQKIVIGLPEGFGKTRTIQATEQDLIDLTKPWQESAKEKMFFESTPNEMIRSKYMNPDYISGCDPIPQHPEIVFWDTKNNCRMTPEQAIESIKNHDPSSTIKTMMTEEQIKENYPEEYEKVKGMLKNNFK